MDPRCQSPEDTGSKLQGPIPQIGNFVNVKTDVLEPRYRAGYVCTQVQIGTLIAMDISTSLHYLRDWKEMTSEEKREVLATPREP